MKESLGHCWVLEPTSIETGGSIVGLGFSMSLLLCRLSRLLLALPVLCPRVRSGGDTHYLPCPRPGATKGAPNEEIISRFFFYKCARFYIYKCLAPRNLK
jgi:hypothetical protein